MKGFPPFLVTFFAARGLTLAGARAWAEWLDLDVVCRGRTEYYIAGTRGHRVAPKAAVEIGHARALETWRPAAIQHTHTHTHITACVCVLPILFRENSIFAVVVD